MNAICVNLSSTLLCCATCQTKVRTIYLWLNYQTPRHGVSKRIRGGKLECRPAVFKENVGLLAIALTLACVLALDWRSVRTKKATLLLCRLAGAKPYLFPLFWRGACGLCGTVARVLRGVALQTQIIAVGCMLNFRKLVRRLELHC